MYIFVLLLFVASIPACHLIAQRKGLNPAAWGVTGAVLGPIGILLLLFIPNKNSR